MNKIALAQRSSFVNLSLSYKLLFGLSLMLQNTLLPVRLYAATACMFSGRFLTRYRGFFDSCGASGAGVGGADGAFAFNLPLPLPFFTVIFTPFFLKKAPAFSSSPPAAVDFRRKAAAPESIPSQCRRVGSPNRTLLNLQIPRKHFFNPCSQHENHGWTYESRTNGKENEVAPKLTKFVDSVISRRILSDSILSVSVSRYRLDASREFCKIVDSGPTAA